MRKKRTIRAGKKRAASGASARPRVKRSWPRHESCFCYIVECSDGTLYTGWAVDAEKRLKVHNAGRGARYTSTRRPVKLVYIEPQPDRITAMKRERAIKRLGRERKQALIASAVPMEAPKQPRPPRKRPAAKKRPLVDSQ